MGSGCSLEAGFGISGDHSLKDSMSPLPDSFANWWKRVNKDTGHLVSLKESGASPKYHSFTPEEVKRSCSHGILNQCSPDL